MQGGIYQKINGQNEIYKMEKYDIILLLSGGYDSAVLLRMALSIGLRPYCLLFNYKQQHAKELDCAAALCSNYSLSYEVINLSLPISSNLTEDKKTYEGVSFYHVPSRNLIFISIAASIAESKNIPIIWYGANYEDREHLFPDCYQEWIYNLNKLLSINGSKPIKVEAPLLGMSKETIKKLAADYGIDETKIFSGYGK